MEASERAGAAGPREGVTGFVVAHPAAGQGDAKLNSKRTLWAFGAARERRERKIRGVSRKRLYSARTD